MKLSDYFISNNIFKDGSFDDLSYSHGNGKNILTFCDTIEYLKIALNNENISSIVIHDKLQEHVQSTKKGVALSDNPRNKFFDIYNHMRNNELFQYNFKYGRDRSAIIATSALVSTKSYIGKNTVISDNVVIKDNVFIAENCFIDSGAILGNEGILYKTDDGNNIFIKHAGIVNVEPNVTILSNAVIVKSVFQNMPTKIGKNSIIGIATTIGHEANLGKNCRILGNSVVAKNAKIGEGTIVGSNCMIRENINIGSFCDVKAGSVVIKNLKDGQVVSGNFALNHNQNVKNYFKSLK